MAENTMEYIFRSHTYQFRYGQICSDIFTKNVSDKVTKMIRNYMNMPVPVEQDPVYELIRHLTFAVNSFGRWHETGTKALTNYTITDYEVVYLETGSICFTCNQVPMTAYAGDLLLLTPFQIYSVECISAEPVSYYYIHFDVNPYYEADHFVSLVIPGSHNICSGTSFPALPSMFQRMFADLNEKKAGRALTIYANLIFILAYIIREQQHICPVKPSVRTDTADDRTLTLVNNSITYIQQNIHTPLKIHDIAKTLGVSSSLLYKSFIRVTGTSPSCFLLTYKVKEAEKYLRLYDMSMTEIADALGFSSAYHFSKTFKTLTGTSPLSYKKRFFALT